VGDDAPDFTLKSPDGGQTVTLSDYRGKRPVALVFGSYT
jgi:peroxiredoxin